MFRQITLCSLLFIFLLFHCGAIDLTDPLSILGSELEEIFNSESVPEEIFPNRGEEADEDNVVFYYNNGFYLFLYNNRVWQVRYDRTFSEKLLNLHMTMSRSEILSISLEAGLVPISSDEDFVTFQLGDSPYVRMKLYFADDQLDDVYVFRADF